MATKLFDRITTLLKADAHCVIESLEERSLLLKQCVREAEIELNRKRARLEVVRDEAKRVQEVLTRSEREAQSLDEDVSLALAGGKEDLARFAARRLLECRRAVQRLQGQLVERGEEARALAERVDVQQAQFENLRARVRAELARQIDAPDPDAWLRPAAVADEEVDLELLRRRQRDGHTPGQEGDR